MRALMLMLSVATSACEAGGPHVDAIEPARGPRGATVVVRGEGFCGEGRATATGACEPLPPGAVVFGLELPAARAQVQAWSDRSITVLVPDAARTGTTTVVVTVDGRSSNGCGFEVTP